MSKRRKKHKPPVPSRFKVGDRVRVKHGVLDTEYPDMPLGGWAGTISEIDRHGTCTVQWSKETLASIHPIYRKRCAIDGTVLEEYWLGDDDLEPDPGEPLSIEQPTHITPRRLSVDEQGDRVRMVFGLTSDDFLPAVDDDSLETYYDHLVERMSLPVEARYCPQEDFLDPSPLRRVTVVALDREIAWDEDEGIMCKMRTAEGEEVVPVTDLEFQRSDPNYQLVDDFAAWFFGDLSVDVDDDEDEDVEEDDELEDDGEAPEVPEEATWRDVVLVFLEIVAFAVSFGAVVGSAVAVMPWARWAACTGGGAWGVIVAVAHVRHARKKMSFVVPRLQKVADGIPTNTTDASYETLHHVVADLVPQQPDSPGAAGQQIPGQRDVSRRSSLRGFRSWASHLPMSSLARGARACLSNCFRKRANSSFAWSNSPWSK